MNNSIEKLALLFKEFPGIGERQAKRFVYFLLRKRPDYIRELAQAMNELKENIHQCSSCFLYFQSAGKESLCDICANPATDATSLLIIEKDTDFESIKRSKTYKGMYFILGGLVPIVTKDTPNFVRTKELIHTIEERAKKGLLKEIILALALSSQGEHTDLYLREICRPLAEKYSIRISSLGRGLSTGSELEYSDSETIKNALKNRS